MGKTANLTSFNLIEYAKQHRYRLLKRIPTGRPCDVPGAFYAIGWTQRT